MENMFKQTGKRGRPEIILNFPKGKFTVNDLVPLNLHVKCRLSLYTHVDKLVNRGVLRYTGVTIKRGTVGKPLNQLQTMASYRAARTLKRNNKLRKLAKVAPVDLTPAPAPAPAPAPVTAVATMTDNSAVAIS